MPTLDLPDGTLYYRVDGAGKPVVFCHGRASTHLSWAHQVADLQSDYLCITFDAKGFGRSTYDGGPVPRLESYVDDLATLVDHLELDHVVTVGQSMGGFAALQYALRAPNRVRGVALSATPAGVPDDALIELVRRHREERVRANRGFDVFLDAFHRRSPALVHIWRAQQDAGPKFPPSFLDPLWEGGGARPDPERFAIPVLLLAATDDASVPVGAMQRLADLIPRAELELIPDCGHCIYWEQPEAYNKSLARFLAGVDWPAQEPK